jgi:predicted RecA/RadA family phage recombinase
MAGVLDPTNPYYNQYGHAGDEISSTAEGRHILVQEGYLVHPTHADGMVDKGDPVALFDGVGVALKSAAANTDWIPIDTEGVWRLSVTNTGLNNFGSITVGQVLFIDPSGVVNDHWVGAYAIFGYALEAIDTVRTEVIAVKVHWQYPYWYYDPVSGP